MYKYNDTDVRTWLLEIECSQSNFFKKNILFHFLRSGSGNTYRNGTCFTAAECTEKGGSASGSCAGG